MIQIIFFLFTQQCFGLSDGAYQKLQNRCSNQTGNFNTSISASECSTNSIASLTAVENCTSSCEQLIADCKANVDDPAKSLCDELAATGITRVARVGGADPETQCLSQGPQSPDTAPTCVKVCKAALATAGRRDEVQKTLDDCQKLVAKRDKDDPVSAVPPCLKSTEECKGKPETQVADARGKKGDPKAKDGDNNAGSPGSGGANPGDPSASPAANTNPNAERDRWVADGLARAPSPSTDFHVDTGGVSFSSGPSAQDGVYKASAESVGGGGGSDFPSGGIARQQIPFDKPYGPAVMPSNNSFGGGQQQPNGPMGLGGGAGYPQQPYMAAAKRANSMGGNPNGAAASLNQQLSRMNSSNYAKPSGGGMPSLPSRPSPTPRWPSSGIPLGQQADPSAQALSRLFGSGAQLPQRQFGAGFIPAGGTTCMGTVFCNVEEFIREEQQKMNSDWFDTSQ